MLHPEHREESRNDRRNFLRACLYAGGTAVGGFALWKASGARADKMAALQEAYDAGKTTQVNVVQRVMADEVRGCILANANGSQLHLLQLRTFNFRHELKTHQDLIVGHHGTDATLPEQGTIIIPTQRGSAAVLEDPQGRKVICTNEHVSEHMPDPSAWKTSSKHDLAILDASRANHITPPGAHTVPYSLDGFPTNKEAAGLTGVVEAYTTNALVELRGVLLDARALRMQGDMALLVTNSPIPASKYGGMSGSVLRHEGKPIASIHGGGGVVQKGDEMLELLSDRNDPRFDECSTVVLSLSGPERLKQILS